MKNLNDSPIPIRVYGVVLIVVVLLLGGLSIASYNQAFASTVPVTLFADRAGLQMQPSNRVLLVGVDVGRVSDVALAPDGQHAELTLAIQPDKINKIPSNVGVSLEQLTAFGNKAVILTEPRVPAPQTLHEGSVIRADQVTVEVNELFENLTQVLNVLQPAKVSSTLGALAQALNGRGAKLGETLQDGAHYLGKIDNDLPRLQSDLSKTAAVADLYAGVAPDLLRLLGNITTTSRTLVQKDPQFAATLLNLTTLADRGRSLLRDNGDDLVTMLDTLRPTTRLLRQYSPEFSCLFKGVDEAHRRLSMAFGGDGPGQTPVEGVLTHTEVEPGDTTYKPSQRAVVSHHSGPNCYGLPSIMKFPPRIAKDDATAPELDPRNDAYKPGDPPLAVQLFGPDFARNNGRGRGHR